MAKKKVGRKKAEEPRDVVKQVRWTAREWEQIVESARIVGLSPSAFVRFNSLQKTKTETK